VHYDAAVSREKACHARIAAGEHLFEIMMREDVLVDLDRESPCIRARIRSLRLGNLLQVGRYWEASAALTSCRRK
jgi:hypothetical protein